LAAPQHIFQALHNVDKTEVALLREGRSRLNARMNASLAPPSRGVEGITPADLANSIIVAASLLVTLSFVGFTSAPGGTMPQDYNVAAPSPGNSPGNATTANLVFWYANTFAFYFAVGGLWSALWGSCLPAWIALLRRKV
jgi:Domain of unknown function